MKDSYSFDLTDEGLNTSYAKHRAAYIDTFNRLGLKYNIVSAMSGAMGGSKSEEFLAPCPTGEDTYVLCEKCGYAANVEAMKTAVTAQDSSNVPAMEELDTPNTPTIDSLVDVLNEKYGKGFTAAHTLKNVLLLADGKAISVLVPGDREVDLKRLEANLSGVQELTLFTDEDFATRPELVKGYVGPQDAKRLGVTLYADPTSCAWFLLGHWCEQEKSTHAQCSKWARFHSGCLHRSCGSQEWRCLPRVQFASNYRPGH
jgi:prolyl-tRNA synthetase